VRISQGELHSPQLSREDPLLRSQEAQQGQSNLHWFLTLDIRDHRLYF